MIKSFEEGKEKREEHLKENFKIIEEEYEYQDRLRKKRLNSLLPPEKRENLDSDGIDRTIEDKYHESRSEQYKKACDEMMQEFLKHPEWLGEE